MSLAREYAARVLGCKIWPDLEPPRPTEELLALASVLLCSGEAEFIYRWQPPGEGSP